LTVINFFSAKGVSLRFIVTILSILAVFRFVLVVRLPAE
jgi:hypothetical protein